jgi:hypothetical protein
MSRDYGFRLQSYAYDLIKDDIGVEFESHLNEWKIHTNNLILYARNGMNNYQTRLETARKAMEAERARSQQMAMFVLSLLAGPAMSFVGGALEHRLAPRLFGHQHSALRSRPNPRYSPPPHAPVPANIPAQKPLPSIKSGDKSVADRNAKNFKSQNDNRNKAVQTVSLPDNRQTIPQQVFDPNWSLTKGKILGDFGGSVTGALITELLINPAVKPATPDQSKLQNAISQVPDSLHLEDLKTKMENAWTEAQTVGKQAMQFYANTIREDNTWGDRLWAKLKAGKLPGVRTSKDDLDLYNLGKAWIHTVVNQQRQKWAEQSDWFYYGHAPAPLNDKHTTNAIEAELWAIWIAQENFQAKYVEETGGTDREGNVAVLGHHYDYDDPEGKSRIDINKILPHLRDLGVVQGGPMREMGRSYNMRNEGMLAAEVKDINGDVDTGAELQSLNQWAANRKPSFFGGSVGFVRRPVKPLVVKGSY